MAENPQKNIVEQIELNEKPIDTVVDSLLKKQKEKTGSKLNTSDSYKKLYSSIKQVLSGFDSSITDCKKYNEAKIHRKYEIRIADLEEEIKILREKIQYQQSARDPSKRYVDSLVDQLVMFKNQNNKLKEENDKLKGINQQIEEQTMMHKMVSGSRIMQMKKIKGQEGLQDKLDSDKGSFDLKKALDTFLQQKRQMKKKIDEGRSKFQIFLRKSRDRFERITFNEFLYQIQEWSTLSQRRLEGFKAQRLRSNILSTLQDQAQEQKGLSKISTPCYLPIITKHKNSNKFQKGLHSRNHYSTMQVASSSTRNVPTLK